LNLTLISSLSAESQVEFAPEMGSQKPRFSLARKYLSTGKYEKTVQVLREILAMGKTGVADEQRATYLLGKTFLLQGQTQLARVSFEHLNKTWPANPYQSQADFLVIEEGLSQMTSPANFRENMQKVLDFQPFNLDLSFFQYFSGFTRGYNFSDYGPTLTRLKPYFNSADLDLRARAHLIHGLIQVFDFHNPKEGVSALVLAQESSNRFLAHQAAFALLLEECSRNLHLPKKLEERIPADFAQTTPGLFSKFLYGLILAYVHGDFKTAMHEFRQVQRSGSPVFVESLKTHLRLLNILSQPVGSVKLEMEKARIYGTHSSIFEALKIYKALLGRRLNPGLRGKVHYLMARLYQDDLKDPASSSRHLKKARGFKLPPEFVEEIEWREVKNLRGRAREEQILEIAGSNLPYTEAAILRQFREKAINPAFLDKYYQSLLDLDLDPSAQMHYLEQLVQIAQDHHQFLKARYFLMKMARFDLEAARELLKESALKEKLYQSRLGAPVSLEPERFQYLQGRYLYLLGKKDEGRKVLESIVKRQSLFAQKAKFELLTYDLGTTPYKSEHVFELTDWVQKDPDPETRKSALNLLLGHFGALFRDFEHLENNEKQTLLSASLDPYLEILKLAEEALAERQQDLSLTRLELLFKTSSIQAAKALLEELHQSQNPSLAHRANLLALEYEKQFKRAAAQSLDLALSFQETSPEYLFWFKKSFDFAKRQFAQEGSLQDNFFRLSKVYLKKASGKARKYILYELSAFLGAWPESELGLETLLENQEPLLRVLPPTLLNTLDRVLKAEPKNLKLREFKLMVLTKAPSSSQKSFLFKMIRKGNSHEKLWALLALSALQQGPEPPPLTPTPALRHALAICLKNSKSLSAQDLNAILELQWKILNPQSRIDRLNEIANQGPRIQRFYTYKALSRSLKTRAPEKVLPRVLRAMGQGKVSEKRKLELLDLAYSRFKASKHALKLKPWVFKINPKGFEPKARQKFQNLSRKINALSVIAALQKSIDWDDPQNPKNVRPFFEVVSLTMQELEDFSEAANILNQMHQYFSDSTVKRKVKALQEKLPLLHQAVSLEDKQDYVSLMQAGEIWLKLDKTARALQTYEKASGLDLEENQNSFIVLRQIRCLIKMNHLQEAGRRLRQIPSGLSEMSLELLEQIEATESLNALPTVRKASALELIEIVRLQLERFLNLKAADLALSELARRPQARSPQVQEGAAQVYLLYYDIAMAQNQPEKATRQLIQASKLRSSPETQARIFYLLGTHFTTYDVNWALAETWLRRASRQEVQTTEGALALLALVSLYETRGEKEKALDAISELKTWLKTSDVAPNKDLLKNRELGLRKGLVLSKIQRYIDELDPGDSALFLQSARALAKNPAYFKEAEDKYLLALRLESEVKAELEIRSEMGDLYLKHARYSKALQQFMKIYSLSEDAHGKFQSGLKAAKIQGLKIQNFKGSLRLLNQLGGQLPNPEQNRALKNLRREIVQRQKAQKKLRLRNLSYNHFPQILDIKKSWYEKRDYAQAAIRYERLLKQSENHQLITGVEYELARVYDLKLKNYKKALEHYQVFLERFDHPQINAEVLLRVAQIQFEEIQDMEAALKSYKQYLKDYPSARKRLAVLFQVAEILVEKKSDYSQALDTYIDISNAYPQTQWDEKAKFARAKLLSRNIGDFEGAIEAYQDLIDHNFESNLAPEAQFKIGRILEIQLSDLTGATAAYEEVLARYPQSSYASQARRQLEKIRRR